jgi:hypothetical protein
MRRALPLLAALALLAIGCSAEEPEPLGLGTGASFPVSSMNGGQGSVTITPEQVRRGEPADLTTATVHNNDGSTAEPPAGTPYYVRVSFCCDGSGATLLTRSLRSMVVARDSEGERREALDDVSWPDRRQPCGKLEDGDTEIECLVYVLPAGTELQKLEAASGSTRASWKVSAEAK